MEAFRMPALGADMEKGKLVQWTVPAGARVKPGDVVAVVETQKGAIDVEIFLDGVLVDPVPVGTELLVGEVLAHVRGVEEAGDVRSAAPPPHEARTPQSASAGRVGPRPPPVSEANPDANAPPAPHATPGARRRAQEFGIDLSSLQGTGPDGSITLADVERAASVAAPPPAAAPAAATHGFDPAQMRAAIAAAMSRSKREIPHYYLTQAIDFTAAERWLADYNAARPPAERLLPAVLLLKATALALAQVPQLNGFYREGAVQPSAAIHVGWAVTLRGGGLVVPAIHDADRKDLGRLMADMRDLVQRARTGGLRSSELTDPTVTVTNLGERGADSVLGVIYPPQLAVIGFGRIAPRPWAVDGALAVRPVLQASLAADHRASDGHVGARFLTTLDAALQEPAQLERSAA